ncbi:MAG: FAD:protein FMN transferase [Actinobacteria bacterium]|nr:FAD:protein FMN transferase [Actinomycetota bacterium]
MSGDRTPNRRTPATHFADMIHCAFDCMGTRIGFWIDAASGVRANAALETGERMLHDFDRRLSRFRPDSELSALNADPSARVAVSPLLARLVNAAIGAAHESDGLVDPTLVGAVERAGYRESLAGVKPAPLEQALAARPPATPARPDPAERWREITVDTVSGTVCRPPGLRIDSGGCGKGLAADMVAQIWSQLLPPGTRFVVDCGGDIRVGAMAPDASPPQAAPYEISVENEQVGPGELTLTMTSGAVATSGVGNRLWLDAHGQFAHHLINPSTGRPAWTGLTTVTAVAPTALEAETIAKTALLRGAEGARKVLRTHGGAMLDYSGAVEIVAPAQIPDHETIEEAA